MKIYRDLNLIYYNNHLDKIYSSTSRHRVHDFEKKIFFSIYFSSIQIIFRLIFLYFVYVVFFFNLWDLCLVIYTNAVMLRREMTWENRSFGYVIYFSDDILILMVIFLFGCAQRELIDLLLSFNCLAEYFGR